METNDANGLTGMCRKCRKHFCPLHFACPCEVKKRTWPWLCLYTLFSPLDKTCCPKDTCDHSSTPFLGFQLHPWSEDNMLSFYSARGLSLASIKTELWCPVRVCSLTCEASLWNPEGFDVSKASLYDDHVVKKKASHLPMLSSGAINKGTVSKLGSLTHI